MERSQLITQRLDALEFSRWHVVVILAIGTIWIFDGYQVSLVSLFSSYILNDHSETQYKTLATAYQLGCMIGSISFGVVTFYYGRRAIFMITLAIYAVGIVMCLAGKDIGLFICGRIMTGLAVGGQFTAIFSAVDEFLPPNVRGRVDIIVDGSWHLGSFIGAFINFLLGEFKYWRMLFGVGFLGILAVGCIRKNIPQSPRWLIMKGREQQAQNIVSGIEQCVQQNRAFLELKKVCKKEQKKLQQAEGYQNLNSFQDSHKKSPKQSINQQQINKNQIISSQDIDSVRAKNNNDNVIQDELFDQQRTPSQILFQEMGNIAKFYKKRLFLSCFLIFAQAFFFNLVYYQFPIVLRQKYNLNQKQISGYMMPLSICAFVGTLLVGPFFDTIGRKNMLLFSYCGAGILLIVIQLFDFDLTLLMVTTSIMFMLGSPAGSSANLIASQLFPTSTRPIVLSLIFILGMFGGMCGVWVDSHLITGILMTVAGVIGKILCPNAEGKSLEEINKVMQKDDPIKTE